MRASAFVSAILTNILDSDPEWKKCSCGSSLDNQFRCKKYFSRCNGVFGVLQHSCKYLFSKKFNDHRNPYLVMWRLRCFRTVIFPTIDRYMKSHIVNIVEK